MIQTQRKNNVTNKETIVLVYIHKPYKNERTVSENSTSTQEEEMAFSNLTAHGFLIELKDCMQCSSRPVQLVTKSSLWILLILCWAADIPNYLPRLSSHKIDRKTNVNFTRFRRSSTKSVSIAHKKRNRKSVSSDDPFNCGAVKWNLLVLKK